MHKNYFMRFLRHAMPLLVTLLLSALPAAAQQKWLTGTIVDADNGEPMEKATLQLYRISKKDTAFVAGTLSDEKGLFSFASVRNGDYLLKVCVSSMQKYQPFILDKLGDFPYISQVRSFFVMDTLKLTYGFPM